MSSRQNNRNGAFTFTWTINNFSHSVQEISEYIESPKFEAHFMEKDSCSLLLFPRGKSPENSGFISLYVMRKDSDDSNAHRCILSIQDRNDQFQDHNPKPFKVSPKSRKGYGHFLSRDKLDTFLKNDTLILRCQMWLDEDDFEFSVKYHAETTIKVEKVHCIWALDNFVGRRITDNVYFSKELENFTLHLGYGGEFDADFLHFGVSTTQQIRKMFCICEVYILDRNGVKVISGHSEFLFRGSSEFTKFGCRILSMQQLLSLRRVILPNGRLTLKCEISFSNGDVVNIVGRSTFEASHDDLFESIIEGLKL